MSKVLGDLRTYLSGITIDSLTACDDQVVIAGFRSAACDCLGSSPCICTTKYTVSYKNTHCLRP